MGGGVDIVCGSLVMVRAGRGKGSIFVAVEKSGGFAFVSDGRKRKLDNLKKKNVKHISPVGVTVDTKNLTNKKLRKLIEEVKTQTAFQLTK